MDIYFEEMVSPIGRLALFAETDALVAIAEGGGDSPETQAYIKKRMPAVRFLEGGNEVTRMAKAQLEDYFSGKLSEFSVPVKFFGTPFQRSVWSAICDIPYGSVASYRDIGERLGTRGWRAVAMALKRNMIPIIVPCHRVIAHNGGLGGYSFGQGRPAKITLLNIEGSLK